MKRAAMQGQTTGSPAQQGLHMQGKAQEKGKNTLTLLSYCPTHLRPQQISSLMDVSKPALCLHCLAAVCKG